jgi:hypothetical protein
VVAAPTFLVCIAWFVARRERQPIRARLPLLVAAINLGMLVYIGAACLEKILDVRYVCGASLWVDFAGLIVMGNLYIIRAWVLFFRHEQAAEFLRVHDGMVAETRDIRQRAMAPGGRRLDVRKYNGLLARSVSQGALKAHSRPDGTGPTSPKAAGGGGGGGMAEAARRLQSLRAEGSAYSFARRRDLVDSRFLTRMMVAVTLLLLVFPLVYSLADRDYVRKKSADCDEGVPLVMFPIYALLYICIFAVAAAKISHIADAFFIATELRLTAAVALVAAVVWTVFQFAPVLKDWNDDHFPVSTLMVLLVAAACLALSIAWPLYRSYVNPPQATIASAEKLETLSELLKIEEAARAFKEFLVTEFSVENLLFWQDVEDIRAEALNGGDNPEELDSIIAPIARAKIIMVLHRFVVADAPFAINLPSEIGQPLRAALPNLEAVVRARAAAAAARSLSLSLTHARSRACSSPPRSAARASPTWCCPRAQTRAPCKSNSCARARVRRTWPTAATATRRRATRSRATQSSRCCPTRAARSSSRPSATCSQRSATSTDS